MSERAAWLQANIEEHGFAIIHVMADDEGPGFSYTIGLWYTYAHPEVIVFGMPQQMAHEVLWGIAHDIAGEKRFQVGQRSGDILEGYDCAFLGVNVDHYADYLGQACNMYGGVEFQTIQCAWPDRAGCFPWEPECEAWVVEAQPLLSRTF